MCKNLLAFVLLTQIAVAATSDILGVTIRPDGKTAIVQVGGYVTGATYSFGFGSNRNSPSSAKVIFTVTSMGYDATGTATTRTRLVYGTAYVRTPTLTKTQAVTFTSGTFVDGETITQATSGATAVIVGGQSAGPLLRFKQVTGSPDGTHIWTGGTSAATALATSSTVTTIPGSSGTTLTPPDEFYNGTDLFFLMSLSDYIYQKDAAGGGNSGTAVTVSFAAGVVTNTGGASQTSNALSTTNVTANNSTVAYPKVVGHFTVENRRCVNGACTPEAIFGHKYGRNNTPVACVKFTVTGQTSTTTSNQTLTSMIMSPRGDGLPVYAPTFTISTGNSFTRGEGVTLNFKAYPYIGDSGATLDSNADGGSDISDLSDLTWCVMDPMISVVDPSSGNDSTGVASTVQATADASPVQTWQGAMTKIAAQNNTSYSLNVVDGGQAQLKAGTYVWNKTGSQTSSKGVVTLMPHSSATQANVIIDGNGSTKSQYKYQRFYNLTMTRSGSGYTIFAGAQNILTLEKVNFSDAYGAWYSGNGSPGANQSGVDYLDCTSNNTYCVGYGNDQTGRLLRNYNLTPTTESGSAIAGTAKCVVKMKSSGEASAPIWRILSSGYANNYFYGWNTWTKQPNGGTTLLTTSYPITNCVFAYNLVEVTGSGGGALGEISNQDMHNVGMVGNSFIGQRWNNEGDITTYVNKTLTDFWFEHNCMCFSSHREDLRVGGNGGQIGNWAIHYGVGNINNQQTADTANPDVDSPGLYVNLPNSGPNGYLMQQGGSPSTSNAAGWINDKSLNTSGSGGGDYRPLATAVIRNQLLSGSAHYPFDLVGNPICNSGQGTLGATQETRPSVMLAL